MSESAHYVHYKPDGTIIGTEYTNNPTTISGTTRMVVAEEVANFPREWRINTETGEPERIS